MGVNAFDSKLVTTQRDTGKEKKDLYAYKNVCMMDVLGFRSMVYTKSKCLYEENAPILVLIRRFGEIIGHIVDDYNKSFNGSSQQAIKFVMISDSIYFFFNDEHKEQIQLIISLLMIYSLRSKIYYRGAISDSSIIMPQEGADSFFVGKGIVESYELESTLSRYSRIILSRDDLFENFSSTDNDGVSYFSFIKYIKKNYHDFKKIYEEFDNQIGLLTQCYNCELFDKSECIVSTINTDLPEFEELFEEISKQTIEFRDRFKERIGKDQKKITSDTSVYMKYYEFNEVVRRDGFDER